MIKPEDLLDAAYSFYNAGKGDCAVAETLEEATTLYEAITQASKYNVITPGQVDFYDGARLQIGLTGFDRCDEIIHFSNFSNPNKNLLVCLTDNWEYLPENYLL